MLDFRTGYHHILLDKPSILKTAFNLPFGKLWVCQSTIWTSSGICLLSRTDDCILKDFNFAIAYIDDIWIFSKTLQEHLSHVRKVFDNIWSANLSMKMSKCNFFSKEIQYSGHILSTTGIQPLTSKTMPYNICNHPLHPNKFWVFLGLVGYYRKL